MASNNGVARSIGNDSKHSLWTGNRVVVKFLLALLCLGAARQELLAAPDVTVTAYQVWGDFWVLEGWVESGDLESVELTFAGLPSLTGIYGTPDETGYFLLFLELPSTEFGWAQVRATDSSGSAFAYTFID